MYIYCISPFQLRKQDQAIDKAGVGLNELGGVPRSPGEFFFLVVLVLVTTTT